MKLILLTRPITTVGKKLNWPDKHDTDTFLEGNISSIHEIVFPNYKRIDRFSQFQGVYWQENMHKEFKGTPSPVAIIHGLVQLF